MGNECEQNPASPSGAEEQILAAVYAATHAATEEERHRAVAFGRNFFRPLRGSGGGRGFNCLTACAVGYGLLPTLRAAAKAGDVPNKSTLHVLAS